MLKAGRTGARMPGWVCVSGGSALHPLRGHAWCGPRSGAAVFSPCKRLHSGPAGLQGSSGALRAGCAGQPGQEALRRALSAPKASTRRIMALEGGAACWEQQHSRLS